MDKNHTFVQILELLGNWRFQLAGTHFELARLGAGSAALRGFLRGFALKTPQKVMQQVQ